MAEASNAIVTGEVRLSYAYLFEPRREDEPDKEGKYGVTILIPKSDKATIKKIKDAIEIAKATGKGSKWGGKIPPNLKVTLHDGDTEKDTEESPEFVGHYYMSCSSKERPGLVDRALNPITDRSDLYSGCYARVAISAFPYSNSGNKGVTFFLNHVQKLRDGDHLDGRSKPEDVFDALDEVDEAGDGDLI